MALKYRRIWVAEQPIIKQECQMRMNLVYGEKVVGNIATHIIRWAQHGVVEAYFSEETVAALIVDGKRLLNTAYGEQVMTEMRELIAEWKAFINRVQSIFADGNFVDELSTIAQNFSTLIMKVFAYFIVSSEFVNAPVEQRISELLKEKYPTVVEKLNIMATPTEPDLLYREKTSWLAVLEEPTSDHLKMHMLQFPFLFCNIDSEEAALKLMQQRLQEETPEELRRELGETERRLANLRAEQERMFAEVGSAELRRLAILIQQLAWYRLELKDCWSGMHFSLLPFFTEIAKRARAPLRDVMMFYTTGDIINLATYGRAVSSEEISARKECYLYLYDHGEILFFSGANAREAKKRYLDSHLSKHEGDTIRGSTANRGKVTGKVKIVRVDDLREIVKIAETLSKEHILVTGMTNPNMMVLVKKVGGIVTDEGGIACHAAIVSREFNIPCIVGTRIATQVLQDGDYVEVDANAGIVRKLGS